ncbi:hypothetical protein ACFLZI_00155 [Nitrospirota bacterium]
MKTVGGKAINGVATAYVCTDFHCKAPVTDEFDLRKLLREATPE